VRSRTGTDLAVRARADVATLAEPSGVAVEIKDRRTAARQEVVKAVVMHQVGRLAAIRRRQASIAIFSGGVTAIAGFLSLNGTMTTASGESLLTDVGAASGLFGVVAGLLAAAFAGLAWNARAREQQVTAEIEAVSSRLADRALLADLLDELDLGQAWLRTEFENAVGEWSVAARADRVPAARRIRRFLGSSEPPAIPMSVVARTIGRVDFASLILTRALESGLVAEALIGNGSAARHGYTRLTPELQLPASVAR
jgi:hypothetical protein